MWVFHPKQRRGKPKTTIKNETGILETLLAGEPIVSTQALFWANRPANEMVHVVLMEAEKQVRGRKNKRPPSTHTCLSHFSVCHIGGGITTCPCPIGFLSGKWTSASNNTTTCCEEHGVNSYMPQLILFLNSETLVYQCESYPSAIPENSSHEINQRGTKT